MRSTKTKEQIFRDGFSLFTNGQIPDEVFNHYMNDEDGEATFELQCWVVNNMRGEIMDWCTGIGIIEAVEHLYETALENGNLKVEETKTLNIADVSDSIFDKAVKHVQETYCDVHLSIPYMLLGDVVELIKITTGKEVDLNVLAKYSH